MAEKKVVTFENIMRDLRMNSYKPVYLLMGEEPYYIDKISDYIADHALSEEQQDFNQTIVSGSAVTSSQISDMARRFPVMSDKQVIIVKEAQNIKNWDKIEKYVEHPVPTTILVLCYKNGTIDKRKKITSKIASVGIVFESKKMRESELPAFIALYLKRNGQADIDNKAAQMIADYIGADLNRLTGELDKLLLSLSQNDRRIVPELVEQQIGVSKDFNPYEMRRAIVNKDVKKANTILDYFNTNPKQVSAFSLVPVLFSYFQNLLIAYYAPQPRTDDTVAKWLDLRAGWAAHEYLTGMRNYAPVKVMQIISKIREIDTKSKGINNPSTPIGELLRELVFFILH